MKFLKTFLSWIIGLFLLMTGIGCLFIDQVVVGIIFILISTLIIPTAVIFITNKTGISLPFKRRIIPLLLMFILAGIYGKTKEDKENIKYFSLNKTSVIDEIRKNIDEGNFNVARDSSEKYLVTNDSDLTKIYNSIKQIEIEKIESELVAEVKNIPASEYRKNLNLYKELLLLNPGNNEYQEKVQFYEQQLEDEKLAARQIEIEKKARENRKSIPSVGRFTY